MSAIAMDSELVAVLHLASSSLPVGAYSYSQGLETAIATGRVMDESSAREWIGDHLRLGVARCDGPVLVRLHNAWAQGDSSRLDEWNAFSLACRDTSELREESKQMGISLVRLLDDLELLGGEERRLLALLGCVSYTTAFALAAHAREVRVDLCVHAFLWSWLEAQVLAAVKTLPLGQRAGQRVLVALADAVPRLTDAALELADDEIATSLPLLSVLSACHETAPARLFRS